MEHILFPPTCHQGFPPARISKWELHARGSKRAKRWGINMAFKRQALLLPGLLLAAIGITAPAPVRQPAESIVSEMRTRLALHVSFRPIEGRLAGGFAYAPLSEGRSDLTMAEIRELRRFASSIERQSLRNRLADRALLALFEGDPSSAVPYIERALVREPKNAWLLSDLSAAYLALAEKEAKPLYYIKALSAADRASDYKPTLAEALFNRAVALEKLHLMNQARRAWGAYSVHSQEDRWSEEAISRWASLGGEDPAAIWGAQWDQLLRRIQADDYHATFTLAGKNPRQVGLFLEEKALRHISGNSSVSVAARKTYEPIVIELKASTGDPFWEDVLAAMARASGRSLDYSSAYSSYLEGKKFYRQGDYEQAANQFEQAYQRFRNSEDPFRWRAYFWLGCSLLTLDRGKSLEIFASTEGAAKSKGYLSLAGESLWMSGLARFLEGDPARSREAYRSALEIFRRIGDHEGLASIYDLLSETLDYQGSEEDAWLYRYKALKEASRGSQAETLYRLHTLSGVSAFRLGEPRAALHFQKEAVQDSLLLDSPVALSSSFFWKSRFAYRAGIKEEAADAVEKAEYAALQIVSGVARKRALADVLLAKAEQCASPRTRLELLTRALDNSESSNYLFTRLEILLARARVFRALRRLEEAELDLERGIELVESWRSRTEDVRLRTSFLDAVSSLFADMISLQIDRGLPSEAFEYAQRARARGLLEWLNQMPSVSSWSPTPSKGSSTELWAADFRRIPEGVVVITYLSINDRVLIWLSDQQGIRQFRAVFASDSLWLRLRQGRKVRFDDPVSARKLYSMLIEPVRSKIPAHATIVFDCDEITGKIPFALLRDPSTGRYLIEDHAVMTTRSLAVYLECVQRFLKWQSRVGGKAFIVGDPSFLKEKGLTLKPLPGAAREALKIADIYESRELVGGQEATVSRFIDASRSAIMIHFAGHTRVNWRAPLWSHLVLAHDPERAAPSHLYAYQIHRLELSHRPIVVLSSCSSGEGPGSPSEGAESLAKAFLAAGASMVVASLWGIKDGSAEELMTSFHRKLQATGDPIASLREAQLEALHSSDLEQNQPEIWGAFQAFGGAAPSNR